MDRLDVLKGIKLDDEDIDMINGGLENKVWEYQNPFINDSTENISYRHTNLFVAGVA